MSLSEREFLLLQHFMRRPDEVCTREELLDDVWGVAFDPGTNVVDVYVGRLRAKLGAEMMMSTVPSFRPWLMSASLPSCEAGKTAIS